ncbi:unnamed protein product [Prorocentrum cordatum]|uniref:5-hmdU DNA kinase helical domain-containing protein n=1 Tax=Prorocentrum cordatum TaxID=2364126 RepID=A0ABN9UTH3_9DINO|nr:unnamed protein product [Polarella glacialis]
MASRPHCGMLAKFWWWVEERWHVLQRRKAGNPAPWSEDRIMQTSHLCNVFKEDDATTKVSQDVLANCDSLADAIVTAISQRLTNKSETIAAVGPLSCQFPDDLGQRARLLNAIKEHGFGGA